MLGKTEGRRRRIAATKDEMVGWHHPFSGHELGQTSGKAGVLQCIGSQRVGHDLATEQQQIFKKKTTRMGQGSRYAHSKFHPPAFFLSIHNLQSLFGLVIFVICMQRKSTNPV